MKVNRLSIAASIVLVAMCCMFATAGSSCKQACATSSDSSCQEPTELAGDSSIPKGARILKTANW